MKWIVCVDVCHKLADITSTSTVPTNRKKPPTTTAFTVNGHASSFLRNKRLSVSLKLMKLAKWLEWFNNVCLWRHFFGNKLFSRCHSAETWIVYRNTATEFLSIWHKFFFSFHPHGCECKRNFAYIGQFHRIVIITIFPSLVRYTHTHKPSK